MKTKYQIIALCVATILGALFTMLASNMFFYDVIHFGAGLGNSALLVTVPAISVAMFFVLVVFYLIRTHKHPDCQKRILRCYSVILMALAFLGIVGDIVGSITVYGTFVGAHPFPGYSIIFLVLNLCLAALGVLAFLKAKKMPADEGRVKINFPYVMKTIGWFLFICMAFNRFGTCLGSPAFIYWRNFGQTFPFYLYLLMPIFLGVLEVGHVYGWFKGKQLFVMTLVALGLNVVFFAYIAIMGVNDTGFISSLSQAMPLERMASKPVELPIHFLSYLGVAVALLIQNKKPKGE